MACSGRIKMYDVWLTLTSWFRCKSRTSPIETQSCAFFLRDVKQYTANFIKHDLISSHIPLPLFYASFIAIGCCQLRHWRTSQLSYPEPMGYLRSSGCPPHEALGSSPFFHQFSKVDGRNLTYINQLQNLPYQFSARFKIYQPSNSINIVQIQILWISAGAQKFSMIRGQYIAAICA